MATYEEALDASLEYFDGDQIAAQKFVSKYALHDREGDIKELTPDDMHRRMAREFARIEARYPNPMDEESIYGFLKGFKKIVPQGGPMSGIGNPYQIQSLSNCFVIPCPYDSYGGILYADEQEVQIMKRRGGVGFDISTIRPKDLATENSAKTTDGIAVFMERYSNSCREVAQKGRRGALMLTISCHHPQIRDFIHIKEDLKRVTGANISIRLTDEFMRAVEHGSDVQLRFPVKKDVDHLVDEWVSASALWDEMITAAHNCAEPGLLFWDTVIERSPSDIYADEGFETISTNPCAEIPLPPPDSCRLMVINLLTFVLNPFTSEARFDYESFGEAVTVAQRLMDDLIDLEIECVDRILGKIESDPEPEHIKRIERELWESVKEIALKGRRTGLGVTGVGDVLAALGHKYGSNASIWEVEEIYKTLALVTYRTSSTLAKERGAFPIHDYNREKDHVFLRQLFDADPELEEMVRQHGRRNIACNTTAPAGTVSLMTQTTSGIEPVFLLKYTRRAKISGTDKDAPVDFVDEMGDRWQEFEVLHHGFEEWMRVTGKTDVEESPYWEATSNDIDWMSKIAMQAAAQKWVDHSISNTTNIPEDTPLEVTKQIYMTGWKLGCKGVTVYRAGARTGVLVKSDDKFKQHCSPKRPDELPCRIHHTQIKGEQWTILVGLMEDKPYEVFGGLARFIEIPRRYTEGLIIKHERKSMNSIYDLRFGFNGDIMVVKNIAEAFDNPNHSAMTRIISLSLRHGAKIQYVVEQLQKDRDADMFSFSKCIARVLKAYIEDGSETTLIKSCPSCGSGNFAYVEGCVSCVGCGWSKCG